MATERGRGQSRFYEQVSHLQFLQGVPRDLQLLPSLLRHAGDRHRSACSLLFQSCSATDVPGSRRPG